MSCKFPEQFIKRYEAIIPDFELFLKILETTLKQCFRINTIKTSKQAVLSLLSDVKLESVPWCDIAFRIQDKINIGQLAEHKAGLIYSQEAVSMIPALILDPKPNEKILDLAAAPGSKTTQIAAMMNNQGLIVANDVSRNRINALISNIERMGVMNSVVTSVPGQRLGYLAPEYFDKVLLDAPCSLEGTIRNTPAVLVDWKESKIKRLSILQKGLINSAYKCLKPEGILVYSTCTFAPEENEAVIDYLLNKYSDVSCEPITINNIKTRPAVLNWGEAYFDELIKHAIRIYPQDNDTEGFFVAKIRKSHG
jgi:NOL1/NOP2/sun family putative RNA methylase